MWAERARLGAQEVDELAASLGDFGTSAEAAIEKVVDEIIAVNPKQAEQVKANPKTIVVLETGNPVAMPWQKDVAAVVAAWFPGQRGGEAITRVLTGAVNPSGRLPLTFPAGADQLVRSQIGGKQDGPPFTVRYTEGAAVGYKWFDKKGLSPLFPFGFGLSYP